MEPKLIHKFSNLNPVFPQRGATSRIGTSTLYDERIKCILYPELHYSGATCLPAECCFCDKNPTRRVDLEQSGHQHHFIECNLFSP